MDFRVSRKKNYFPPKCNIPTAHLTFIIQLLLPKQYIGLERNESKPRLNKRAVMKSMKSYNIGSYSEGYNIPDVTIDLGTGLPVIMKLADFDILDIIPFTISATDQSQHHDVEGTFESLVLELRHVHSGYARIQAPEPHPNTGLCWYLHETKKFYFDAKYFIKTYSNRFPGAITNGPAISYPTPTPPTFQDRFKAGHKLKDEHEADSILALSCTKWSDVAKSWMDRQQKGDWLDDAIIDKIVALGFHLVPVAHRQSIHANLEWRISFAMAETFLAKEIITNYQRQCFIFLKIIHFIKLKPFDILTSYHLKTVFLYTCEKLPVDTWRRNMGSCLLFMINSLIACVSRKCLPSFFIPENNLIDYFTNDEALQVVSILIDIRKNPLAPVLEFTDNRIFAWQGFNPSFRDIIKPMLKNSIEFREHGHIQKSIKHGCISVLKKIVQTMIKGMNAKELLQFIIDTLSVLNIICGDCLSVDDTANSNAITSLYMSVFQFMIAVLDKYVSGYADVDNPISRLASRKRFESMCHLLANMHQKNSDERLLFDCESKNTFRFENTFS